MKENLGLTNDFVFRNIFGAKKNSLLLLSLVNAVLQAKGLNPVVGINPVSPFLPVHQLTQREGILDVQADNCFAARNTNSFCLVSESTL